MATAPLLSRLKQIMVVGLALIGWQVAAAPPAGEGEAEGDGETLTSGWFPKSPFWWNAAIGANVSLQHPLLYSDRGEYTPSAELTIFLSGEYGPLFLETQDRRVTSVIDSGRIGVHLYRQGSSELSLTFITYMQEISDKGYDTGWGGVVDELRGIHTRDADGDLGFRWLRDDDENIYSAEVVRDITGAHDSYIGELSYTHIRQVRNADLRFNLVLTYFAKDVVDYYFGVSDSEVTASRPAYSPSDSFRIHSSISALQPVTENWLFESGVGLSYYGQEITNSPLVATPWEGMVVVGIRYVF